MRLSADQVRAMLECIWAQFGPEATVVSFCSRLDDLARGGDVDLLVESRDPPSMRQRAMAKMVFERRLNLPVDIVAVQRGTVGSPFIRIARNRSRPLELQPQVRATAGAEMPAPSAR